MFDDGACPEEIVEQFDVLRLDDVYAVITYYLRHREEVRAQLAQEDRNADEVRQRTEAEYSSTPLRARLRRSKGTDGPPET
jgi:hypothetical protein